MSKVLALAEGFPGQYMSLRLENGDVLAANVEDLAANLSAVVYVPKGSPLASYPSGQEVDFLQGGTIAVPASETPLVWHPVDPARAPFALSLSTPFFVGAGDPTVMLGYNVQAFNGAMVPFVSSEPSVGIMFQSHHLIGPDAFTTCELRFQPANALTPSISAFGAAQDSVTGALNVNISYAGSNFQIFGGPFAGPQALQATFQDGLLGFAPNNYVIEFTGTGTIEILSTNAPILMIASAITFAAAINVDQVSVVVNYTIDSGANADCEVWVNSSAGSFTVTLPAPTRGRKLWIVDSGNSLAAHNVTLARHGAESINGVAASLTLVTSGARYEISSDGTNWWVNKMVVGG